MPNQSLAKGIFLAVVAVFFSVYALQYDIGSLSNAGPGLFPSPSAACCCCLRSS